MKQSRLFPIFACCLFTLFIAPNAFTGLPAARVQDPKLGCTPPNGGKPLTLPAGCKLPFDSIKSDRGIDHVCPTGGCAELSGNPAQDSHRLLNVAKNNFCAAGSPAAISYKDFVGLQAASDKVKASSPAWWTGKLPTDRTQLPKVQSSGGGRSRAIGEGTKVVFVGYIREAKYDDTETGEDVNCKIGGAGKIGTEDNDIHISVGLTTLTASPATIPARCQSITAEISPHFRPAVWEKVVTTPFRKVFQTRPVRITGTLLFDAEHVPCQKGAIRQGNPVRISVWEIHPVYAIDVCKNKSLARCEVNDNSDWTPFDQFDPATN